MRQKLSTTYLARTSAQHPWRTVAIWLGAFALAIALIVSLLGGALSTDATGTLTTNPESAQADHLMTERLGESNTISEIVVVRSGALTVDDPTYQAFVERLTADLIGLGESVVLSGTNYFETGDASLVSADRKTTLITITVPKESSASIKNVHTLIDTAVAGSSFETLITGQATLDMEIEQTASKDLARGEGIGLTAALIILVLVFGAVAAAFLPVLLAIMAIAIALGATALLGQAIELPFFVLNVMTMMGLAVGIDYSLFVVSRFREERAKGQTKIDAIAATGGTAGRTVALSGVTVGVALAGLLLMPDSSSRAIGMGALLVVLAAVLSAMTLLPAVLSLMGDRIEALHIPALRGRHSTQSATGTGGFWAWSTRTVMRRPVVSLVIAGGLLLAAAFPVLDLQQGEIGMAGLPDGLMSKNAYVVLEQEFGFGQDLPAIIVIDGQTDLPAVQSAIATLQAKLDADSGFVGAEIVPHADANLTIMQVQLAGDATGDAANDAIKRLRSEYIPQAFAGVSATALVTGQTARTLDLTTVNNRYTPFVIMFVLGLSFIFLLIAFRSILIPIKAIVLNMLSVAATYGLLVLVFQKGVGADLLGFQQVDVIQTGLPLFIFAILFGLSMDYHIFLLSRIREHYQETGSNSEAVAMGLQSTSRLISGAALIMVAVFSGFALGDMVALQQLGFGLGVAVLLDATIVRSVLVPASMRLAGKWNWYLPNWLGWLPQIRLEGSGTAQPEIELAGSAD
ncbi:MAG TPA: MMPL family transporter [Thermomicrobiales bacterium]|mgnify:CR=1 FL=1|nr:MMPL family transporter [Thermomicrobiales bacterium]